MGRKRGREVGEDAKSQLECVRRKHRDMMLTILGLHSNDEFRSGMRLCASHTPNKLANLFPHDSQPAQTTRSQPLEDS